jgi:hypothetical protein
MSLSGMVFACLDFIVAPDDTAYFLEANQMGQFLWVEEKLPELPLLDAMCNFLASGNRAYRWSQSESRLRYADYLSSRRSEAGLAGQ